MEPDNPSTRDAPVIRWAKFASIVIVLAVVVGAGLALVGYVELFTTNSPARQSRLMDHLFLKDTPSAMRWRFVIGAVAGGVGGLVYVVRCLRRGEEP